MSESPSLLNVAVEYHEAGWHPIELPRGAKEPPPGGRTGYGGVNMTAAEVATASWLGNVALRMPTDVLGLDVDAYKGGDRTLKDLFDRCGPLPQTWISFNGRLDGSGIRFFRVPPNMVWITALDGIEIIQWNHRYAVVFPSLHPEGRPYQWVDQAEGVVSDALPLVEDLPELPWPWIAYLSRANRDELEARSEAVDLDGLGAFIEAHTQADAPSYIHTIVAHFKERTANGRARHDTMQHCLTWALEYVAAGVAAAQPTLIQLGEAWVAAHDNARRAELWSDRRTTEFESMVRHAVGKANAKTEEQLFLLHNEIAGPTMNVPDGEPEVVAAPKESGIFLDWSAFTTREGTDRKWLVEAFWPWGRSMALWAAAKTGKSELALWCAAKLALGEHPWTGERVEPVEVAYFDYEMTEDDLEERLDAFAIEPDRLARLHYALLPAIHALDAEAGGAEMEGLVRSVGARAVVIDTFGRAVSGDENEADTVRAFYRHTGSRLKRLGIGYLRTDHAGKDMTKGQRGSSAKRDDVDVIWSMTRGGRGAVKLDCGGSTRLGWVGPDLQLDRVVAKGIISYSSPVRFGWPPGTAAKAAELDELNIPLELGRPSVVTALRAAGRPIGNKKVLESAIKYRKDPLQMATEDPESGRGSDEGTSSEDESGAAS